LSKLLNISRPLSIGDIIGRAFRIFRVNILLIAQALILPTVLLCIGRIGFVLGLTYFIKGKAQPEVMITWGAAGLAGLIILLIGGFVLYIRQLSLVRLFTGFAPSFSEAYQFVKGRIWAIFGLGLAYLAAIIASAIVWSIVMALSLPLFAIKGMVGAVAGMMFLLLAVSGGIFTIIYIAIVAHMTMSSMAIESDDLGTLITHSGALTARAFFRSFIFLIVTALSVSLIAYPLSLPLVVIIMANSLSQGIMAGGVHGASEVPIYIQVISQVWEQLISMVVGPITFICYGLYYCDLRMRQEGLDLIERVDSLELQSQAT